MHMCPFLGSPHTLHLYTTIDADAGQEKKNRLSLLAPRKKIRRSGRPGTRDQEQMPLTPAQEANVRELFSMCKDAFQRDHKRKCDAIDAMMNNFVESYPGDSKEVKIKRLKKRLKSILGSELVDEVSLDRRTKLRASRVKLHPLLLLVRTQTLLLLLLPPLLLHPTSLRMMKLFVLGSAL